MVKQVLLILASCFSLASIAQNSVKVDGDRFSIKMVDDQPLFFDGSKGGLGLVDGPNLVFAGNMWVTGYDQNDTLRGAANTFNPIGTSPNKSKWVPGTINTNATNAVSSIVLVTAREIESHKTDYLDPNYEIPEGINNWPANGDTTIGEMWQMAPFVDKNDNGLYEPETGEYPEIIGEECIYVIKNDLAPEFPYAIGMELHIMISMFDVDVELTNVLDNTVLLNATMYHRGSAEIDTLHVAAWFDVDIGNFTDDYMASNEKFRGLVAYNGDSTDESAFGHIGFGNNPPALAIGSMFCGLWGVCLLL